MVYVGRCFTKVMSRTLLVNVRKEPRSDVVYHYPTSNGILHPHTYSVFTINISIEKKVCGDVGMDLTTEKNVLV